MKTVIAFSGGLDSTYVLWKLLSSTDDEVTAIHVDTTGVSPSTRYRYDLRAFDGGNDNAQLVVDWLQANVRSFTYIRHDFDEAYVVRGIQDVNNTQTYLVRYLATLINDGQYDQLVCCPEKENDGYANGGTIFSRRPGGMAARDLFISLATRGKIDFPLIETNYTQAVALKGLPKDLSAIVYAQGTSQFGFKLQKKMWFQTLVWSGKTPEEIWDIYYAKCTAVPGKWHSMKFWVLGQEPTEATTWDMPTWPSSYEVPSSG